MMKFESIVSQFLNSNLLFRQEQQKTNPRPRTAVNRSGLTFKQAFKTLSKDDVFANEKLALKKTLSLENEMHNFGSACRNVLNSSSAQKPMHQRMKTEAAIKKQVAEEVKMKAKSRDPTKGISHKQRKLLNAAKANSLYTVTASGLNYFEADVNVKDEKNNTPLYYTAMAGNLEFCQFLTDLHANVNESCEKGNTPLHMAFKSDHEGVMMAYIASVLYFLRIGDYAFAREGRQSEHVK